MYIIISRVIGTAPDTYSAVISIRLLALLWDDCGNMGQVMVPVRTHGAASGVLSMIGGGNFGSGFVSGAVASGIGSIPHSSDVLRLVKLVSGSVAGGLVAYALGGRFIQGAIQGLKIGFFNHYVHDTRLHRELMQDANGNLYGELAEFVCEGEYTGTTETSSALAGVGGGLETISSINTFFHNIAEGLKKGGNSTIGNNGKFYFHPEGERGFYGNQYRKTYKLSDIGKSVCKYTQSLSNCLGAAGVVYGICEDCQDYNNFGKTYGYHTVRAAAEWFGGYAGGSFGLWFRGWGGNAIAGPPGAMVCGFTLGLGGAWGGATLGGNLVDCIYRTNDLIIP
jgi:hypothetical protein